MSDCGGGEGTSSWTSINKRDPLKSSVSYIAAQKRRQHAITVGKERREAAIRTKRVCRDGVLDGDFSHLDDYAIMDDEEAVLDAQTTSAVEELKSAASYIGKGAVQKKIEGLRSLRRLLSKSSIPPIEAALQAGAVPILVQCLSFGSQDEQLLEAAWCLTNIAAGEPNQTLALLPALPLLIAHLGVRSSIHVAEQCAWAIRNLAGEGVEMRSIILTQGALPLLAQMLLSNRGSTAKTAAWTLSNLIKGPDPKAATELIKINGVLESIIQHLKKLGDELATEVSWVVVYLSALSNVAVNMLVKSEVVHLLVERLAASEQFQLLIPVLRSIGNLVAGSSYITDSVLIVGHGITDKILCGLNKCLRSEYRVLKKEAAWVLSNIAAASLAHKKLIYSSGAVPLLLDLVAAASFDIKKEAAYALGNLCVDPAEDSGQPKVIVEHLAMLVSRGCLSGFVSLVRSSDTQAAKLGLQFLELVMRGLPNCEGPKLVEKEDGIAAMERFQFHENQDLRNMANKLVDTYFGEDYGLDEE